MKTMKKLLPGLLTALIALSACDGRKNLETDYRAGGLFTLSDVAKMLSELPLENEHLAEVHDAVSASTGHGYDEEYLLTDLFEAPGAGVGDKGQPTKAGGYRQPLRELFADYLAQKYATKAGAADVERYINALSESDIQIYWPYSEDWDGERFPLITYDPGYGAQSNYAYEIRRDGDALVVVDSVYVDENVARSRPVWVINRNDDSAFTPVELVRPREAPAGKAATRGGSRVLYLKHFQMLRNYDSWFAGASEFFIKCGSVQGFKATTEAELKLYSPSVTDFMVVVRRKEMGLELPLQAVLLTDFTNQLEKLAFLITEDDGGTWTSWKCSATVKVNSKSYGFDVDIPYRDKDDIVWRGQLDASFFQKEDTVSARFGDVIVGFELE
jgi:hypothetical protein